MEHPVWYLVGIDPQTSLLAIDIRNDTYLSLRRVKWFQVLLRRKDSFQKAEDWQNYIVDQCLRVVDEIEAIITTYHDTQRHYKNVVWKVLFGVEQQRGRVKTIPETCLVTAARAKGWTIRIPHPKTWKKVIEFNKPNAPPIQGNKANKERAEELYGRELNAYCAKEKVIPPKVIHHLCDAACIVAFLSKVVVVVPVEGKNKTNTPTTKNEDEKEDNF
jgi:hypothetical protein